MHPIKRKEVRMKKISLMLAMMIVLSMVTVASAINVGDLDESCHKESSPSFLFFLIHFQPLFPSLLP